MRLTLPITVLALGTAVTAQSNPTQRRAESFNKQCQNPGPGQCALLMQTMNLGNTITYIDIVGGDCQSDIYTGGTVQGNNDDHWFMDMNTSYGPQVHLWFDSIIPDPTARIHGITNLAFTYNDKFNDPAQCSYADGGNGLWEPDWFGVQCNFAC